MDGDGFGDSSDAVSGCTAPTGYVAVGGDCDDDDDAQYPGADEYCNGEDDDCNALTDDNAIDRSAWYSDADEDGFGDPSTVVYECDEPRGLIATADDCDDEDDTQNPDADEVCNGEDDDCDETIDEDDAVDARTWYIDSDRDGFGNAATTQVSCNAPAGFTASSTDCDDSDSAQFPGADEYCNGEDDDCDSVIDEDDAVNATTWYADSDSDGFGDASASDIECNAPSGFIADNTDCDDHDDAQYPGATEFCNEEDDDCDSVVDEDDAVDATTWYADSDSDGFGDASVTDIECNAPSGFIADNTDCDDRDDAQYPGATEFCNEEDDDCDSVVDEDDAADALTWYADSDSDGFGDASVTDIECNAPSGFVADNTDCDDRDDAQYPGATEFCNEEDDDCDSVVDEDDAADVVTWYADSDSDGFGDAEAIDIDCNQPSGFILDSTDCDDRDDAQYPGATEFCNEEDDDCDSEIDEDEAADVVTWYADTDSDGFGDAEAIDIDCNQPSGFILDSTDCDDSDDAQYPGATEFCNEEDDDCDSVVDEDDAADALTWFEDADRDGFGDALSIQQACEQPLGFGEDNTDCDDSAPDVFPGAEETCGDGIDSNCDGAGGPEEDEDGDGLIWLEEDALGTQDCDTDSDDDALEDGEEVRLHGTNPALPDTDADCLLDGEEVNAYGTDPLNPDTDEDGLTDCEEINEHGTDPSNADSDAGGVTDGDEVQLNTNPLQSNDDYPVQVSYSGGWGRGCATTGDRPTGLWLALLSGLIFIRRRRHT